MSICRPNWIIWAGNHAFARNADTMELVDIDDKALPQRFVNWESEGRQVASVITGFTVFTDGTNVEWDTGLPCIDSLIVECVADGFHMVVNTETTTYSITSRRRCPILCKAMSQRLAKITKISGGHIYGYLDDSSYVVAKTAYRVVDGVTYAEWVYDTLKPPSDEPRIRDLADPPFKIATTGGYHQIGFGTIHIIDADTRMPVILQYSIPRRLPPRCVPFKWCGDQVVEMQEYWLLTVDSEGRYNIHRACSGGYSLMASNVYYEPEIYRKSAN